MVGEGGTAFRRGQLSRANSGGVIVYSRQNSRHGFSAFKYRYLYNFSVLSNEFLILDAWGQFWGSVTYFPIVFKF